MDQYLLEALQSQAITYKEVMQLQFFELMLEVIPPGLKDQYLPEVPKHLWPALDRISLFQQESTRQ
jgi:hypothetical protein